jgi:hypothetical protein
MMAGRGAIGGGFVCAIARRGAFWEAIGSTIYERLNSVLIFRNRFLGAKCPTSVATAVAKASRRFAPTRIRRPTKPHELCRNRARQQASFTRNRRDPAVAADVDFEVILSQSLTLRKFELCPASLRQNSANRRRRRQLRTEKPTVGMNGGG